MIPKPQPREPQACPICRRTFRAPKALLRHVLKCKPKGTNRLHDTAKKTRGGDYLFDSRLERRLFEQLRLRELAGELSQITVKPNVRITKSKILVIPDFSAIDTATGELRYHEAKGFRSEVWLLKMRLWRQYGPAPIDVYVAGSNGPVFSETIAPGGEGEE